MSSTLWHLSHRILLLRASSFCSSSLPILPYASLSQIRRLTVQSALTSLVDDTRYTVSQSRALPSNRVAQNQGRFSSNLSRLSTERFSGTFSRHPCSHQSRPSQGGNGKDWLYLWLLHWGLEWNNTGKSLLSARWARRCRKRLSALSGIVAVSRGRRRYCRRWKPGSERR